ncbi:hypothetical protein [Xanthomonas graminis]|uniref:hypothetical protein n=1 Tax=Xanthomonas graminis TaxID=3390026 RepID=UPI0012DADB39|nr:hypothetical protein [Xanthomonas translucens]
MRLSTVQQLLAQLRWPQADSEQEKSIQADGACTAATRSQRRKWHASFAASRTVGRRID